MPHVAFFHQEEKRRRCKDDACHVMQQLRRRLCQWAIFQQGGTAQTFIGEQLVLTTMLSSQTLFFVLNAN